MIQILLNLFLTIVLIMVVAIPVLVRICRPIQRYKCNVEMVFSGQMNNNIYYRVSFYSFYACCISKFAVRYYNGLMVRDGLLSSPTWFSRDLTDDVCLLFVFNAVLFHCSYCMPVRHVRFYNK